MENTALHYACIYNYKEVVDILLARPSLNPYLRNKEHKNPLDMKIGPEIQYLFENFFKEKKRIQEENRKITIHKVNPKNVEKMFEVTCFDEKNTNPSVSFSKVSFNYLILFYFKIIFLKKNIIIIIFVKLKLS